MERHGEAADFVQASRQVRTRPAEAGDELAEVDPLYPCSVGEGSFLFRRESGDVVSKVHNMDVSKMLEPTQAALASKIFHTLLYTGRIASQWSGDEGPVEIGEIRLANLLALMEVLRKKQTDVAHDTGTNPGYLSQIINRHLGRKMGSALARKIESAYGLERGYMDHDHTKSGGASVSETGVHRRLSEKAVALGMKWDRMSEPTKSQVSAIIDALEKGSKK